MKTNRLDVAVLAGLALLVFHGRMRLAVLDPRNVGWMQQGDWPHYLAGWSFYRWDAWRFPIGYFSNLLHPVGTSTGLTDSIPWLALVCKLLDPWLPHPFQYFGFYLLLCFFLQGLIGFRIMRLLTQDRLHALLSAALLMAAPVLLDRLNHVALCSQWMILALILWNIASARAPESTQTCCRKATLLNFLAAVTHPYVWAMTFLLSLPLFARRGRQRGGARGARSFLGWVLLQPILAALGWWVFGYLVLGSAQETGFGYYGGRLWGFFDAAGRTKLTPRLSAPGGSPEGFDFVGVGVAIVLAMLLAASARRLLRGGGGARPTRPEPWQPSSPHFFLFVISAALWLYSLTLAAPLFRWLLGPLAGAFRASGRFSWPLYYCVVLFLLARYRRAFPSRAASALLLLLVGLQLYDLKPYWLTRVPENKPLASVGADPFWRAAGRDFRHLVLWPQGSGTLCGPIDLFAGEQMDAFILYAAGQYMTVNAGVTSRPPQQQIEAACAETARALSEDRPAPATLYVVHPAMLPPEALRGLRNFSCHAIDGVQVCAAAPFEPRGASR